jgi:hypothetical protein
VKKKMPTRRQLGFDDDDGHRDSLGAISANPSQIVAQSQVIAPDRSAVINYRPVVQAPVARFRSENAAALGAGMRESGVVVARDGATTGACLKIALSGFKTKLHGKSNYESWKTEFEHFRVLTQKSEKEAFYHAIVLLKGGARRVYNAYAPGIATYDDLMNMLEDNFSSVRPLKSIKSELIGFARKMSKVANVSPKVNSDQVRRLMVCNIWLVSEDWRCRNSQKWRLPSMGIVMLINNRHRIWIMNTIWK